MAQALRRCLLDMDLRSKLIAAGHDNAAQFSWSRTARQTLDVYRAVAS
jgi:glycosyltransferase involved in cell wall biosynthesis